MPARLPFWSRPLTPSSEDFRNNTLLRELAENASQGDGISEIELHTTCAEDMIRLIDYMTYGYSGSLEEVRVTMARENLEH